MTEKKFTPNQLAAIKTRGTSLCVNANAGAGKTSVLIERIIDVLVQEQRQVTEILAITFTEKAALELKERLSVAMKQQGLPYWEIENGYISTIHSFCARILRENCFNAGINPGFGVLGDAESQILLEDICELVIDRRLESDDTEILEILAKFKRTELTEYTLNSLAKMRTAGLGEPELFKLSRNTPEAEWQQIERYCQRLALEQYERLAKALLELKKYSTVKSLEEHRLNILKIIALPANGQSLKILAEYFQDIRLTSKAPKDSDPEAHLQLVKIISTAKAEIKAYQFLWKYDPAQERVHSAFILKLTGFIAEVGREYSLAKKRESQIDYEDMQLMARDLLRDNQEVRQYYRDHFCQVLVDEFQDTNPLQNELVRLICRPDNLFIVGDWKQSIYLFRNADVAIFRNYLREFSDGGRGQVIQLQENFRSNRGILEFVNLVAGRAFLADRLSDGRYEALTWTAGNLLPPEKKIFVNFVEQAPNAAADDGRRQEAVELARALRNLKERGEAYKSMTILLRNFSHLSIYENALKGENVPYYLVGGRGYFQKQEIIDVLNYLMIIDNPFNDLALIGVLRSELVNLHDETIFLLTSRKQEVQQNQGYLFESLAEQESAKLGWSDAERQKLERFLKTQRELASYVGKITIPQLVALVLERTRIKEVAATHPHGEQIIANLNKLVEISKNFAERPEFSLRHFVKYIEALQVKEAREEEALLAAEDTETVKIMTIHKAKGMQFPIVVLADIFQERARSENSGFRFSGRLYQEAGLPLGIRYNDVDEAEESRISSLGYELIKQQERAAEISEARRLWYVALTRAQDQLLIFSRCKAAEEAESDSAEQQILEKHTNWGEWLKYFYDQEHAEFTRLAEVKLSPAAKITSAVNLKTQTRWPIPENIEWSKFARSKAEEIKFSRLSVTQACELLADETKFWRKHYIGLEGEALAADFAKRSFFSKETSERIGNYVHNVIATAHTNAQPGKELDNNSSFSVVEKKHILKCLENYFNSRIFRELSGAEKVFFELPFEYLEHNFILNGRMDLVYLSKGIWHIVDFKTNQQNEENLKEYTNQLTLYAYVLARQTALSCAKIQTTLFYLSSNELVKIEADIKRLESLFNEGTLNAGALPFAGLNSDNLPTQSS